MSSLLSFATSAKTAHGSCAAWISALTCIISLLLLLALAFVRINRKIRVAGTVWNVVAVVCAVIVTALHACRYSLITLGLSALLFVALFLVLSGEEKPQFSLGDGGSYVIASIDGKTSLSLFDSQNQALAKAPVDFSTVAEAERYALRCKKTATAASFCDMTEQNGDLSTKAPTFAICVQDSGFACKLFGENGAELLVSATLKTRAQAKRALAAMAGAVLTSKFFAATANDDF